MSSQQPDRLDLGVVVRAHGLRGAVGVKLFFAESTSVDEAPLDALELRQQERRYTVSKLISRQGERLVLALEEVRDRDAAEALRGAILSLERSAVALEEGEYLYADLLGCVATEGEREVGRVADVFSAGASDVLVVRSDEEERLIPLVEPWVGEVDIEARRIELHGVEQFEGRALAREKKGKTGE